MNKRKSQTGMVLVIGLVFLLLMTVMSIAAMQTGGLDERMASNANDRNVAFQAAEAALRQAETVINAAETVFDVTVTTTDPDANDDDGWVGQVAYPTAIAGISAQPIYVIQCVAANCVNGRYRVTARGQGEIATSVVVLETVIGKPID